MYNNYHSLRTIHHQYSCRSEDPSHYHLIVNSASIVASIRGQKPNYGEITTPFSISPLIWSSGISAREPSSGTMDHVTLGRGHPVAWHMKETKFGPVTGSNRIDGEVLSPDA